VKQKSAAKLVLKKQTITSLSNAATAGIKGGDKITAPPTCGRLQSKCECIASLRPGCIDTWDIACTL
jgi:hypothetical protein